MLVRERVVHGATYGTFEVRVQLDGTFSDDVVDVQAPGASVRDKFRTADAESGAGKEFANVAATAGR